MLSRQYGGAALGSLLGIYRSRRHLSWEEPLWTQGPTLGVTAPGTHSGAAQAGRSGRAWASARERSPQDAAWGRWDPAPCCRGRDIAG